MNPTTETVTNTSAVDMNLVNAELAEIAAQEKAIADRKAAAVAQAESYRKENRAKFLNGLLSEFETRVKAFGDETLFSDLADNLESLAPNKRSPRLGEEELEARNSAIAEMFRTNPAITARDVAAQFGVSEATVNTVKKNAGLVAPRAKAGSAIVVKPVLLEGEVKTEVQS